MNRIALVLTSAFLVGLFFSCSAGDGAAPVYSDPGQAISANAGSEIVLSLSENSGSTGYSWRAQVDSVYLSQVSDDFKAPSDPIPGKAGTRFIKFKALKAGQTKITMLLERPWEKDKPAETKVFNLTIK